MWIKGLYEKDIACVKIEDLFGRYALVEFTFELEKEKQSIAVSANPVSIETTHSAVLEFPNGEIIKIPEPGEGWIEKIIWDEWHGKDYKESEINAWKERVLEINRDYDKCETYIVDDDEVQYQIVHHCGFVIVNEYENRINEEHPNINRLTRWTREVKPKVETIERYTQSEFPMLEGPQPTSGFEIEDHKVVFRKQDTSTKYPGANKRAPDPKWSGVWLEGHAPPIKQKD
jgi:hypothetical protein